MIVVHHVDKWGYCNLDLVEEVLEKEKKAIVETLLGKDKADRLKESIYY